MLGLVLRGGMSTLALAAAATYALGKVFIQPGGAVTVTQDTSVAFGEIWSLEGGSVTAQRGRGLGGRALELVEAEARRLAVRRLFLEVEHGNRALNLYRRAGYVDRRRFLMSKSLDR